MKISPGEVKGGDILVGKRLLITPALLIDNKTSLDEGRLFDFSTLMNALTIHDRIITLPALIPDNFKNSQLYEYLCKKNLLYELDIHYNQFSEVEILEIEDLFDFTISEKDVNLVLDNINNEYYHSTEYSKHAKSNNTLGARNLFHGRSKFFDEILNRNPIDWSVMDLESRHEIVMEINRMQIEKMRIGSMEYFSQEPQPQTSKFNEFQLHLLRTAVYWEIAGKYDLAFLPDLMRIPIISQYHARLRLSLRMFIGSKVDDLIKKELTAALQIAAPILLPIPNSVSTFLNRYSKNNLEDTLDNMRDEFIEQRKAIINWEKRIHGENMNSYEDVLKVMREVNASLEALQPTDWTKIAVSATSNVVNDTVNSFLTSSISTGGLASFIQEGINLIKRWHQRKRISYFNSGKKEALNTKIMNNLLAKAKSIWNIPNQKTN